MKVKNEHLHEMRGIVLAIPLIYDEQHMVPVEVGALERLAELLGITLEDPGAD